MAHRRVAGAAGIGWRTSLGSPTRGLSGSAAARWGVVLRESLWSGLVAAGDADRGVEAEAAGRRPSVFSTVGSPSSPPAQGPPRYGGAHGRVDANRGLPVRASARTFRAAGGQTPTRRPEGSGDRRGGGRAAIARRRPERGGAASERRVPPDLRCRPSAPSPYLLPERGSSAGST
jgi:hypothetical protein